MFIASSGALLLTTQMQVFSREETPLGKVVNYASRELTQIPVELTLSPPVEQLHLGFNKLEVLNKKFFRLPLLSELNLDQNLLAEIPGEFKHFSGLTILSLKVLA
jgi:hypothetical protein